MFNVSQATPTIVVQCQCSEMEQLLAMSDKRLTRVWIIEAQIIEGQLYSSSETDDSSTIVLYS